ncbi:hypothetical protein [Gynuella sunshinyii]|uniref:Tellurite resistance protein n=1 Tax=Gynuella sunshinyii YC6258 TaxID=1445510 RepID=A0A0C5VL82_9GAMM|nr:hypothetical protein [Gynuella sunshinyii]AJQ95462.1 hypothetical Protein YC6258_03426 [Gynuella sunshinyii YC6258]
MEKTLKMAGKFASHAIWSVSSGETLIPIVGYLKSDGSNFMERLVMDSIQAISLGEKKISELGTEILGAAFIKDGLITLETGKTDALIIDVRFSENNEQKLQFIIPYRNANHSEGFAVHRLKITKLEGFSEDVVGSISNAFFDGLESHKEGGKIWNEKYVDQAGVSVGYGSDENTNFSSDDFETLKQSVFLIFFLVAAADGKVDKKELIAFIKLLSDPEKITNTLLNRIVTNVINDVPTIISEMAKKKLDYIEELGKLKKIIDNNLSAEEANSFKISLFLVGREIAEASGGFFGFGSKISKEEKGALAAIALCLGVTPS